jgi:hypothetical protein
VPLSQASLATKIQAEIIAQFGAPADAATLQKFANAIAKAVVDEIQANALVSGTVTSGAGAGGAVTGTVG